MAKGQTMFFVLIGLVILGVVFLPGLLGTTQQATVPVAGAGPSISTLDACDGKATIEDTTVHFDVRDRINLTVLPDTNATPEIDGKQRPVISNINAGGTFQASPGDSYKIHLREDTSVDTSATDYYYEVIRGNIECVGTETLSQTVGLEGAINVTVKNLSSNANVNNTPATGEGLEDGESISFQIILDGNTNDAYWGNPSTENPLGILLVCDFNNADVLDCEPSGTPFVTEAAPKNYSNVHGSDTRLRVYQLTNIKSLKEFESAGFNLVITALDNASPNDGGNNDINVTLYDSTAFPDDDTGDFTWGWIDEDGGGTEIGATNETFSINLD